jgi:ankyrin repeat protein
LLEAKANVESKDSEGRTPLQWAALNGHEAIVKLLLLEGKADVESNDNNGRTPFLLAALNGHEAIVQMLLKKGVNTKAKTKSRVNDDDDDYDEDDGYDSYETTALHLRAKGGHEAVVRLLLENSADIDAKVILDGRRCTGLRGTGTRRWCGCSLRRGPISWRRRAVE